MIEYYKFFSIYIYIIINFYRNFYHYLKENYHTLNINDELLEFFRNNIRYTSREKFKDMNKKYPKFTDIYNGYLNSSYFKKLFFSIKRKYDNEYQKLFFRHSFNFLNFYLKENDPLDNTSKKEKTKRKQNKSVCNSNKSISENNSDRMEL